MNSRKTILIMTLALISFRAFAQHDQDNHGVKKESGQKMDIKFEDKNLSIAYDHYIHLKKALVASQATEAKMAADKLEASLGDVSNSKVAKTEAAKVASATTLNEQRNAFATLSYEMVSLVKDGELSMGEVFLDYCPMAKASWLSNEKEIRNPYFGDKMLKCGRVKETIN